MAPKIIVRHWPPPIPDRRFDFEAHYEGEDEETRDTGYGPTEEAARRDLIDNYEVPA